MNLGVKRRTGVQPGILNVTDEPTHGFPTVERGLFLWYSIDSLPRKNHGKNTLYDASTGRPNFHSAMVSQAYPHLESLRGKRALHVHLQPLSLRDSRDGLLRWKDLQRVRNRFGAINSNDVDKYPQDNPEKMRELKMERDWSFPFLFDATQEVAHEYKAACTPDFYLFNSNQELVYRGQMDGSRPGNDVPVTGEDLLNAVRALSKGQGPVPEQRPSLGCNIKWKPGNEPELFPYRLAYTQIAEILSLCRILPG